MNRHLSRKGFLFTPKGMALTGVMAAAACVVGPFSIPLPFTPVPISLTNLVLYLTVYLIGMKCGTVSCLVYLLLGFAGLPVFSAFTGGAGKLLGPTGGYLIGFLFLTLISGFFIDRWPSQRWLSLLGMILGTAACYLFGTVWAVSESSVWQGFPAALLLYVVPFLPGDGIKIILALLLGPRLKQRIRAAGLLP